MLNPESIEKIEKARAARQFVYLVCSPPGYMSTCRITPSASDNNEAYQKSPFSVCPTLDEAVEESFEKWQSMEVKHS